MRCYTHFCLLFAEVQGIDGSVPLSPQWLLPKPGENKPGMVTGLSYPSVVSSDLTTPMFLYSEMHLTFNAFRN